MSNNSAYPEFIDPRAGDISGVIRGFSEGPTKFGDAVTIDLELDDGTHRTLWLTHTVLKNKVARLKPDVGERIDVRYLGKRDGAANAYHDFAVTMPERPEFKPDWDAIGDEDPGPEPARGRGWPE